MEVNTTMPEPEPDPAAARSPGRLVREFVAPGVEPDLRG